MILHETLFDINFWVFLQYSSLEHNQVLSMRWYHCNITSPLSPPLYHMLLLLMTTIPLPKQSGENRRYNDLHGRFCKADHYWVGKEQTHGGTQLCKGSFGPLDSTQGEKQHNMYRKGFLQQMRIGDVFIPRNYTPNHLRNTKQLQWALDQIPRIKESFFVHCPSLLLDGD